VLKDFLCCLLVVRIWLDVLINGLQSSFQTLKFDLQIRRSILYLVLHIDVGKVTCLPFVMYNLVAKYHVIVCNQH
jgi:hypothetical protein